MVYLHAWNWSLAEKEFRRAIALNPGDSFAHEQYGTELEMIGRMDEAIKEMKRARDLDPLSTVTNSGLASAYFLATAYDEAIRESRALLELDPNASIAHGILAKAYARKGLDDEAFSERLQALRVTGDGQLADDLKQLAKTPTKSRGKLMGERIVQNLIRKSKQGYVSPFDIALVYCDDLGDRDRALLWLQKAYEQHSYELPYAASKPIFESLHSDSRFQSLMAKVGSVRPASP
jgi:tetratricopeptide (TPR) repeat protein